MLAVFLPFYVVQSQTMAWISRGRVVPILTDVAQMLTAPAALKAVFIGLLAAARPQVPGHRQRRRPLRALRRMAAAADLPVAAGHVDLRGRIRLRAYRPLSADDEGPLALVWSWYNIVVLFLLCLICIEQPRLRQAGRFSVRRSGERLRRRAAARLPHARHLGERRAFRGRAGAAPGTTVLVRIGRTPSSARIVRSTEESFAVRFENSLWARAALVRHIYSAMQEKAIRQVRATPLVRALVRRIMQ